MSGHSTDSDQIPCSVVPDLGQHCLWHKAVMGLISKKVLTCLNDCDECICNISSYTKQCKGN